MNYLFDTSILISIQKGHPTILEKLYTLSVNSDLPPAITTFSYAEFFLGILGGSESKRKPHIDFYLDSPLLLSPLQAPESGQSFHKNTEQKENGFQTLTCLLQQSQLNKEDA